MQYDVFISYSNTDRIVAEEIRAALRKRDMKCWMAPENVIPGSHWAEQIEKAIRRSKVVVLILSVKANESEYVLREAEVAISNRRGLIPYRIENINPEGGLRFYLGVTHYLDALFPASTDPENLDRLCDAIEDISRVCASDQKKIEAKGTLMQTASRNLRIKLGEEMVRQKQTVISIDAFTPEEKEALVELESLGILVDRRSPAQPLLKQYTAPSQPADCINLLSELVVEKKFDAMQLLDLSVDFSLLLEAGARVLLEKPREEQATLIPFYGSIDRREIEILIRALVGQADLAGPPDRGVHDRTCRIASLVLNEPSIPALRGLLLGGQQLIARSRLETAISIFDQIEKWGEEAASSPDLKCLLIQTANERARAEIRQGNSDIAEKRLRQALESDCCSEDPLLAGILTNNLARALMDSYSTQRRDEAIRLLEDNLSRLEGVPQRLHLAAAYNILGDALKELDPDRAEEYFQTDIRICREMNDDMGAADALHSYGNFLMHRNRYEEAGIAIQEELALFSRFFDPRRHARALSNSGRVHLNRWKRTRKENDLEEARAQLQSSKEWFLTASDEPKLFAPTLETLGRVLVQLGRREEGLETLEEAITQYKRFREGRPIADEIKEELYQLEN